MLGGALLWLQVLEMLDLEGCHSDGFEGRGLAAVAALPALSHLNLKGCKNLEVSGNSPPYHPGVVDLTPASSYHLEVCTTEIRRAAN
jgi:hypothetical protein